MKRLIKILFVVAVVIIGCSAVASAQSGLTKVGAGTLVFPSTPVLVHQGYNKILSRDGSYLALTLDSMHVTAATVVRDGAQLQLQSIGTGNSTNTKSCWEDQGEEVQICFNITKKPDGTTYIGLLLPAVQKVRAAAGR